jgi:hypothetical protein
MWHVRRISWSWELIQWKIGIHIENKQYNGDRFRENSLISTKLQSRRLCWLFFFFFFFFFYRVGFI